jgi:glutathione S-transferase
MRRTIFDANSAQAKRANPMGMELYELVGQNDHRFSPYAWRSRLALAHKGLEAAFVPCRLTDKDKIAFSKQERVPVLKDGDTVVPDSWAIACYLEDRYPDRPSLFGGPVGRGVARVVNAAADSQLIPAMARLIPPIENIFDARESRASAPPSKPSPLAATANVSHG